MCTKLPLEPRKPWPPLGKLTVASTTVIAPASISVISARYSPRIRRAGSPTTVPSTIVITPEASRTTGNGSEVANSRRAETQAPIASTAVWPRHQADPADQHAQPERHHRVHRHLGHGVDVVEAEQLRQREQHEQQQDPDRARPQQRGGVQSVRPPTLAGARAQPDALHP